MSSGAGRRLKLPLLDMAARLNELLAQQA